ncbi:MAG: hypothetical protein RMK30_03890 [Anaerolineae bacterium]|nr:hypothetical protein [Anaerolineae bacterium]MDW8102000.1 hypothetical protein [Anaerolineae bacterium]
MKRCLISVLLIFTANGCRFSDGNSLQLDLGVLAGCVSLVLALAWLIAGMALIVSILVFLIFHFFRRRS